MDEYLQLTFELYERCIKIKSLQDIIQLKFKREIKALSLQAQA